MSTVTQTDLTPKTPRILISTFGMGVVASLCAGAGYSFELSSTIMSDWNAVLSILCYAALILPYFYVRSALLEGPQDQQEPLTDVWMLLAAVCISILAAVIVRFYSLANWTERWSLFVALVLALAPFACVCGAMLWQLRRGKIEQTEQRRFKNRVLVPAFCTCLVSFTYGWSIAHPASMLIAMPIPILLVGAGALMSARRWGTGIVVVGIAVTGTFIVSRIFKSNVGDVIAVGTLLTLAMGVAEVCKRTVWINQKRRYIGQVIGGEDENFYMAGSNWSSAVFPLLLFFLPLLIPGLPVAYICIVLAAQFLVWHFWSNKKSNFLVWFNVFLGFALPLVIILQHVPLIGDFTSPVVFIDLMGYTALFVALTGIATAPWNEGFQTFLRNVGKRDTYRDPLSSYFLFLFVAFSLILIIGYLCLWADPRGEFIRKGMLTILYILALLAGSTAILFVKSAIMPKPPISSPSASTER